MGKADTHVHTKYSGLHRMGVLRFPESVSDPKDVIEHARSAGMNVVCITDHNSIAGAKKARELGASIDGIEVVMGEEVSTADGEVIGLFLEEEIPAGLPIQDTIDRIRSQDGLVIAPHPFSLHCPCLGERINELDVDGIEVLNGGHIDNYANPRAEKAAQGGKFARMGGSDSHYLKTIGITYTNFDGTTAEELRKAILNKRTSAGGRVMPLDKAIAWSVSVVLESDRLIVRSMFGLDRELTDDPIHDLVHKMKLGQKLGALVGSFVYFLPPVPYLVGIASKKVLHHKGDEQRSGNGSGLGHLGLFD
ncbi:MAG: PHP-associated domain-containing protein [Methanomassiliicoccus sp.]|nr:PHP-associated domain-containing protein [Methanomassiliicoccus sp.]